MKLPYLIFIAFLAAPVCALGAQPSKTASAETLEQTIARLDAATFDAFNRCTDAAELEKHAGFFAEDVEFYHDNGGVTWNRADMLANTKKNVCGNYTRELIPGSLVVYPIKDFGAIEMGSHRFCQVASGQCEGLADFTIVWHQTDAGWKISRVLSYGHRTNPVSPAAPQAVAAIHQVVESFRTSLIHKDKATYMSLFFSDKPEDIGWQYVSEDVRLDRIRKTKPDAIKARKIPTNNFIGLIDEAVATPVAREETFSNVRVETDGEIASVSFDYSFLADGKKTNWGKEMWQLVRTESGWKIFSVVYTIRDELSADTD